MAKVTVSPADLVAVVTLSNSLNVDLDFTADKEALKSVIAKFNTGSNEGLGAAEVIGRRLAGLDAVLVLTVFGTDREGQRRSHADFELRVLR